jgi:hypothetical protein
MKGAALGDDQRVVAGLGQVGEQSPHLRRRSEEMVRGQPVAIGILDHLALGDAHQRVVRLVEIASGK